MPTSLDHNPLSDLAAGEPSSSKTLRRFHPLGTVRCDGRPGFRSQLSRDLGLLLDLDDEIASWRCLPAPVDFLDAEGVVHPRAVDFLVVHQDGSEILMDAEGPSGLRPVDPALAYSSVSLDEIRTEPGLTNAREMMRYARWTIPLGDRVRLLAWLEDVGSVPLIEAAAAMRGPAEPIGAVMALVLKRFVSIDWREAPIGPETLVRLRR